MDYRSGAHDAWLQRDVERRVDEPIVADGGAGCPNRQHLGMGARIAGRDRRIGGLSKHGAVRPDKDGTDRYFTRCSSAASERQSSLHVGRVCVVHARARHSHSIVAGGFVDMSYETLEIPGTSLMIRFETRSRNSYGKRAQRAVMKSIVSTARSATT